MSTIEVMLDARDILGIYDIPDYAEASLMEVMRSGVEGMRQYARSHHRFNRRTGSLIQAMSAEAFGLSGRVYIDDLIAYYGVYVHEGQRSWAPDQFIYKAVSALLPDLKSDLHQALALAQKDYTVPDHAPMTARTIPKPIDFSPRYPVRGSTVELPKGIAGKVQAKVDAIERSKNPVLKKPVPPKAPEPVNRVSISNLFKLNVKKKKQVGSARGLIGELLAQFLKEEEFSAAVLAAELKKRLKARYN